MSICLSAAISFGNFALILPQFLEVEPEIHDTNENKCAAVQLKIGIIFNLTFCLLL